MDTRYTDQYRKTYQCTPGPSRNYSSKKTKIFKFAGYTMSAKGNESFRAFSVTTSRYLATDFYYAVEEELEYSLQLAGNAFAGYHATDSDETNRDESMSFQATWRSFSFITEELSTPVGTGDFYRFSCRTL